MSAKKGGLNLQAFLNKHQKFKTKVDYTFEELRELIDKVRTQYQNEGAALIDLNIPLNIVGDIHGQYADLQRIFAAVGLPGKKRYLFLGDYIDRGPASLECICSLLAYRLAFPKRVCVRSSLKLKVTFCQNGRRVKELHTEFLVQMDSPTEGGSNVTLLVFLLRGNHECDYVNRVYGFWDELQVRFPYGIALNLFKMFNDLFNYMPLAALVRKRILCMHGGLSPHLTSIDDIRNIRMPVLTLQYEGLAQDLLWSDPKLEAKGFEFNDMRECSVMFGPDVVHKTCKKLGLDLIVRAHQVMHNGYGFFANRRLVTVFSAPRYLSEMDNKGAILQINNRMVISFTILNPVKPGAAGADHFKMKFKDDSASAFSSTSMSAFAGDTTKTINE